MTNRSVAAVGLALVLANSGAWAVIYDPAANPSTNPAAANPQALAALDAGVADLKEAQGLEATLASSKDKTPPPALRSAYVRARKHFDDATKSDAESAEAWNGLGFCQRKLGDYDAALASYDQAFKLKPGYPEAIEYRGEAYLGLGRLDDAKNAYLELFPKSRSLADTLLGAMKQWIAAQKSSAAAGDLAKWVEERSKIAAQTASLTRDQASAGWQ